MVDLRIFRNPRFTAASLAITMVFLALFGWLFLFTQQLQFVLGYDALQAGVRALPFAVTMGIVSPAAAQLAARIGTKVVVAGGLAIMAGGFWMVSLSTVHTRYPYLMIASVIVATGMALAMAPATESIMGSLPPSRAGVGSAVNDTTRQTGGALGVAVIGSVFAARYHARIGSLSFLPPGSRATARESIGTSLQTARTLGGAAGKQLVHVATQAYLSSMRVTYAIAVAIVGVAVVVAYRYLPAHATARPADLPPDPALGSSEGTVDSLRLGPLGDG